MLPVTAVCPLTVDEALAMALEFAERAEAAPNEQTGARYAAIGQIYADIAAVRQQQTTT